MSNSDVLSVKIEEQSINAGKKLRSAGGFRWSVGSVIFFIVFALYAASLLGSLLWVFENSLKTKYEYMESVVRLPAKWLFSNYIKAFEVLRINDQNALSMLFNSLWLSLARPAISIATSCMASYVMAKYKFPCRGLIWGIMLTTMVIPIYGSGSATLILYKTCTFTIRRCCS